MINQLILDKIITYLDNSSEISLCAVFDFDNTCVINDIQQALVSYMCRHELLRYDELLEKDTSRSLKTYHELVFRHYWTMIKAGVTFEAYIYALRMLVGYGPEEVRSLCNKIIAEEGNILGTTVYHDVSITRGFKINVYVRELLDFLIQKDFEILIISGSPQVLVETSLRHFSFPNVPCVGTRLEEENGVYIDKLIKPTPIEEGKITCTEKYFGANRKPLIAVGDTMNDFAILQRSTIPIAVERGNELTDKAHENGWLTVPYK